jgi:hypothetical protein
MSERFDRQYCRRGTQITNKHSWRLSASQEKPPWTVHAYPQDWQNPQVLKEVMFWLGYGITGTLEGFWSKCKLVQSLEKNGHDWLMLKMCVSYDPTIPLFGLYSTAVLSNVAASSLMWFLIHEMCLDLTEVCCKNKIPRFWRFPMKKKSYLNLFQNINYILKNAVSLNKVY